MTRVADGAGHQRHSVSGGSVHVSGSMTIGGDKYQHDRGFLRSYCDRVVEEHEEPLGEAIRAAGLVHLARKKRRLDASGARAALGLSDDADENDAAAAQARRELHPDKGGDRERFLAVVDAYEALTAGAPPTSDLYRSVCVDVVGACAPRTTSRRRRFFPPLYRVREVPAAKKPKAAAAAERAVPRCPDAAPLFFSSCGRWETRGPRPPRGHARQRRVARRQDDELAVVAARPCCLVGQTTAPLPLQLREDALLGPALVRDDGRAPCVVRSA